MEDVKDIVKNMCRMMLERPDLRTSKVTRNETRLTENGRKSNARNK